MEMDCSLLVRVGVTRGWIKSGLGTLVLPQKLDQALCEVLSKICLFPVGFGKLHRRFISQLVVRAFMVVHLLASVHPDPCIVQRQKPVPVQTFQHHPGIQGIDERMVCGRCGA